MSVNLMVNSPVLRPIPCLNLSLAAVDFMSASVVRQSPPSGSTPSLAATQFSNAAVSPLGELSYFGFRFTLAVWASSSSEAPFSNRKR
jgi:hypothetical protein